MFNLSINRENSKLIRGDIETPSKKGKRRINHLVFTNFCHYVRRVVHLEGKPE